MNQPRHLLHGISQVFPTTWGVYLGSCFGLSFKQDEDECAENRALQPTIDDQIEEEDGDLLSFATGEDDAVKSLQPLQNGHEFEVFPPPTDKQEQEGDDWHDDVLVAADDDLRQEVILPKEDDTAEGRFQPICATCTGGKVQPANEDGEGALPPTIGVPYYGQFFQSLVDYLQFDVMHAWKQVLLTYMHAEIGGPGKVHDDVIIVYAKPRVDPKVKKKTSLLLCLFIDMPFHPGEHGHDGIPSSRHHEPCSSPCSSLSLYIESLQPPPHSYTNAPSSSDFSLLVILSNEDKEAYDVLEAAIMSIELPFIPLRGSKRCQAHERQCQSEDDGLYWSEDEAKEKEDKDGTHGVALHQQRFT